jgi:hypothetical protein
MARHRVTTAKFAGRVAFHPDKVDAIEATGL